MHDVVHDKAMDLIRLLDQCPQPSLDDFLLSIAFRHFVRIPLMLRRQVTKRRDDAVEFDDLRSVGIRQAIEFM